MTIIDVRTSGEFLSGHVEGSINIPLNTIATKVEELKMMNDIVVCCASGIRSMQAVNFLKQNNIDCEDGGSWMNLVSNAKNYAHA